MTLNVRKAIMKGSELGNLFPKQKSEVSRRVYTKHRNNCVRLWKKAKFQGEFTQSIEIIV